MQPARAYAVATLLVATAAAAAATGCLEESRQPAGSSDSTSAPDTAPPDTSEPECTADEPSTCLSYTRARECEDGAWVEKPCTSDSICEPATGRCVRGQHTCLGVLLCTLACTDGEQDCAKNCSNGATVDAVDALGALNECQCETECWPILCGKLFPWPGYAEISACVAEHCPVEAANCLSGGPTGDDGCKDVRDCILACDGDAFCSEQCMSAGQDAAQVEAAFYTACVYDACGASPEPNCLFNVQANDCAALWAACQGESDPSDGGDR